MARPEHTLYTSLALVKKSLGIPEESTDQDDLVQEALGGACEMVDTTTGRFFWRDQEPTVRVQPARILCNPGEEPLLLIADVVANDTTDLVVEFGRRGVWAQVTDFDLEPPTRLGWPVTGLRGCWPTQRGQHVRITAVHGWPAVPPDIAVATRLQATRLYRRKDSPHGVIGSADWGVSRVSRADPDVAAMLADYTL